MALVASVAICASEEEAAAPARPKAVEVKVTGAKMSYVPVEISSRRRNARSETSLLKKATALLSTSKVLTYRRKELPCRTYRLTVERKDPNKWFLLISPEVTKKPRTTRRKSEKAEEPDGRERKTSAKRTKERDESRETLRIPLSFVTVKSEDHRVVFGMTPIEKGKRLQIVIRAGSSQLRGALRWKVD